MPDPERPGRKKSSPLRGLIAAIVILLIIPDTRNLPLHFLSDVGITILALPLILLILAIVWAYAGSRR
jgi:hypothetical protein